MKGKFAFRKVDELLIPWKTLKGAFQTHFESFRALKTTAIIIQIKLGNVSFCQLMKAELVLNESWF